MPTILRIGAYRFFFYSNENGEPPHIHVQRDNKLAKFWLKPVLMSSSIGFSSFELRRISKIVVQHKEELLEAWDEYFRD
ncbi:MULTISPECIES: DUF4160 domain-containing protein [Idiomarina]|jgi:hypothetical protein|uniref:DUF4160 domain-containing protein n=1 Tax=Idiomarina TaxID=135575 RepID=UPI0006C865C2|nr:MULTISPECIES: DUF4160 domain-containing protein [Idiomarina]RDX34499.1 DUF4160 domain-containing protein [Idiomarina sp. HD9-110m-PIT-SAG05]KPD20989.1 hypothetical protein ADS78_09520 [Idiomarina abyssalis]MBH93397.1 DUF4160 domain-containing protein [Idiomarina sp.]MBP58558.1 DUF4160 domain-containing protein [Idiomarina sp.]QZN90842.1 DUF4160 domain-containing protein [Idiomarina abyssalis]|tara:strand:- start:238 stop:474 length:237 start_codon:yes stop_codon:yes gene_type:complete